MFKTGNSFMGYFLMVTTFLPLVPVILVFLRRIYLKEPFHFLMIICLLGFLDGLIRVSPSLNIDNQYIVHYAFSLLLFLLFVQLFKPYLGTSLKYLLSIFLAAFLSAIITYGTVKGWGVRPFPIDILLSCALSAIILLALPSIVQAGQLQVFRSPLFWIAGGTLFYLLLFLLLEWIGPCCLPFTPPLDQEKMLFLSIADLVRYLLYVVAGLTYRPEEPEGS
jgi:hypothetical protein